MRRPVLLFAVLPMMAVAACALTSNAGTAFTPAQTAHFYYTLATAGVNDASAVAQVPGLSPAVKSEIKAGATTFVSGVEGALASLTSGGTAADQAETAAATALGSAATSLQGIVGQAHGTSASLQALATAGGVEAAAQLPAVAATYIALQNGYAPTPVDLANDVAALNAANAALQAE